MICGLLVATWALVYAAGGTKTATPHLFYIPILFAALPFKVRGASVVALVAAVLCGTIPIDSVTGESQAVLGILIRGALFLTVGTLAAVSLALRQRIDEDRFSRELQDVMNGPARPAVAPDTALTFLVRSVLRRREFHPVFQPIYSLHNGELIAVEALTRFDVEPYRTPDLWFSAAEHLGLGTDLEIAAIEAAIEAAADLPPDVMLSVNASPTTLADPRLSTLLLGSSRRFTLELTEHAVVTDYHLLEEPLDELRRGGVLIAVDDAGAGFASLQHVIQLAPDVIKLDISLTQNVGSSQARTALGRALIEFVHRTGATLIVEGIESVADLLAWSDLGADAVQGYLVGRPAPMPVDRWSVVITALLGRPASAATHV